MTFRSSDMKKIQKQKIAKEYAEKVMSAKNVTYAVVHQAIYEALNARDEEEDELQAKLDEATKLEKSMTYNIEHLKADMAQLQYENTILLNQCEEQRGYIEHLKSKLSKVKGGNV